LKRAVLCCLQVFTFALKPLPALAASQQQQLQQLQQQQQGMQPGAACGSGWELQLVMEYCDEVGVVLMRFRNSVFGQYVGDAYLSMLPSLSLVQ
jgi:hypothetical protein